MVCNQTNGYIIFVVFLIYLSCHLTYMISQCTYSIYIKNRIYILYNTGQTFQSHTGINIFILQCCIISITVVLELGKYIVPDLHITVTVTSYGTAWFSTAILFSTVIVDLRTWSTRSCTVLPEVVFLTKTENTFRCNTYFFIPDIKCFIIIHIHGWIQAIRIQSNYFRQEFPGPVDGFMLEIISKREVTQHLKECTMTCGLTYILNIAGTNTLLAGSYTPSWRDLSSCKIRLQRSHTCIDQQQTLVILWYEGKAFHNQMAFALEKVQIHLTKFIYSILFHIVPP